MRQKICKFGGISYMKATGIVRRIDDLGRVVIPKEIRRTMRIREGDPLEIFTNADGEVIFKKYSPIGELTEVSSIYAEVMFKNSTDPVIICDRDHVIAASGVSKKEVLERRVSPLLEEVMEQRKPFVAKPGLKHLAAIEGIERTASIAIPILAAGDVCGAVMMMSDENSTVPKDSDVKMINVAAAFLGRQLEG